MTWELIGFLCDIYKIFNTKADSFFYIIIQLQTEQEMALFSKLESVLLY